MGADEAGKSISVHGAAPSRELQSSQHTLLSRSRLEKFSASSTPAAAHFSATRTFALNAVRHESLAYSAHQARAIVIIGADTRIGGNYLFRPPDPRAGIGPWRVPVRAGAAKRQQIRIGCRSDVEVAGSPGCGVAAGSEAELGQDVRDVMFDCARTD